MRKLQLWVALSVFAFCSALFADQVVLKNGDRLTGTITKSDDKTLLIKTEFAGDVTVQWPAVQEVTSTQPLHVALSNGKTVVGPVTTTDGSLAVVTPASGTVNVSKADVTALRSDAEQADYEKSLHPGLLQGWKGGANVGFAFTAGNSQTSNLALAFTADRKTTQRRHLALRELSLFHQQRSWCNSDYDRKRDSGRSSIFPKLHASSVWLRGRRFPNRCPAAVESSIRSRRRSGIPRHQERQDNAGLPGRPKLHARGLRHGHKQLPGILGGRGTEPQIWRFDHRY